MIQDHEEKQLSTNILMLDDDNDHHQYGAVYKFSIENTTHPNTIDTDLSCYYYYSLVFIVAFFLVVFECKSAFILSTLFVIFSCLKPSTELVSVVVVAI